MVDNWWKAHELKYVVGGIAILAVLLAMGIYIVVLTVRERRRRRQNLDAWLAEVPGSGGPAPGRPGRAGRDGEITIVEHD